MSVTTVRTANATSTAWAVSCDEIMFVRVVLVLIPAWFEVHACCSAFVDSQLPYAVNMLLC
jgi:hypothetical protein